MLSVFILNVILLKVVAPILKWSKLLFFDKREETIGFRFKLTQGHKYKTFHFHPSLIFEAGNTKGGSIIVPLTSCLTGLDLPVLQIKTKIVSSHTVDSKPVKQEVNGTVILPSLVFPV
jgi:hypothetical protein